MASFNRLILIGRLTDNPEPPRTLPNGNTTVVKFRFAQGRSKKDQNTGQWVPDPNPCYIDCEIFQRADSPRKLADLVSKYAQKGSQLHLEGRLQLDQWDDKTTGQKRSKHKFVVESVEFLDSPTGGGGGGEDGGGTGRGNFGGGRPPARQQQGGGYPDDGDGHGGNDGEIPF